MAADRHFLRISCAVCQKVWSGPDRAHCSGCHHTFDDATLFDGHRDDGQCRPPGESGLIQTRNGIWLAPLVSQEPPRERRTG